MTSISLPPLQFEDGGFRVSIITGPSTASRPAVVDAKSFPEPEVEPKDEPEPEPKPEQEQKQEKEEESRYPAEPQHAPPPQSQPPRSEVTTDSSTGPKTGCEDSISTEPEIESKPQLQLDSESKPEIESELELLPDSKFQPEIVSKPKPQPDSKSKPEIEIRSVPQPELAPIPEAEPLPVLGSEPVPIPDSESTPVPETESMLVPEPTNILAPEPGLAPIPESTPVPAPETTIDPTPVSELVGVPACLLVGHRREPPTPVPVPVPEETPQAPTVPSHPIASMQLAFAESLDEVTKGGPEKPRLKGLDARARRERLLDQDKDDQPFDARWRYRPGQTQHEVLKLISQITFGVYLLLNGMANDTSQVISILQGHIDEVDEFLEVALEDLAQACTDLDDRISYLKLPMSNVKVFEEMLEDRNYRAEILEGNEKIDQVLGRMNIVMKQWEDDVEAGLQGAAAFNEWLNSVRNGSWRQAQPELVDIFDAMKGNAEGWLNAFDEMESKTRHTDALVAALMNIVAEMEQKVGEASRKTWSSIPPFTSPASASLKSRKDNSSVSSPPSIHSNPRSTTRVSVRSLHLQSDDEMDDDGLGDFPLPGVAPLLPPPRSAARVARKPAVDHPALQVDTAPKPPPVVEAIPEEEREDSPLYILQPRTYTPQPPEPLPSPRVRDSPTSPPSSRANRGSEHAPIPLDARSITQRTSTPRGDICLSAGEARERPSSRASPVITASPRTSEPRRSNHSNLKLGVRDSSSGHLQVRDSDGSHLHVRDSAGSNLQVRDSAGSSFQMRDSSGSEMDGLRQHRMPRVGSHVDLRTSRPSLIQSANSDYQHYHPVLASPHSPLQQRPHTAAGPQAYQPSGQFPNQGHNQPAQFGGMATHNTIASSANENRTIRPNAPSIASRQTLKKKKSAFGWFKKAFTMDDDERAAFEARKNIQQPDNYYKDTSPKFLDGRRIR